MGACGNKMEHQHKILSIARIALAYSEGGCGLNIVLERQNYAKKEVEGMRQMSNCLLNPTLAKLVYSARTTTAFYSIQVQQGEDTIYALISTLDKLPKSFIKNCKAVVCEWNSEEWLVPFISESVTFGVI